MKLCFNNFLLVTHNLYTRLDLPQHILKLPQFSISATIKVANC